MERGKYYDKTKYIRSDIFFNKSSSIDTKIKERPNKVNIESSGIEPVRRKSVRPEFIKNPFESQISSFH